jgi:hypothetical protein
MSRTLTTITHLGLVALMITACSQPRKAAERRCLRADRHQARAVWLCPDMLTRDSATVTVTLPPDSSKAWNPWADPVVDSLLNACADLALATIHKNDSLTRLLMASGAQVSAEKGSAKGSGSYAAAGQQAQARLRAQLCQFDPIESVTGLCHVRVRWGEHGPLLTVEQRPFNQTQRAPCPPQLTRPPCPTCAGVASWWRTAALLLLALLLLTNARRILGVMVSLSAWGKLPGG